MIQAILKLMPQVLDTTYGCGDESGMHSWATITKAAAVKSLLNFVHLQSLLMAVVNTLQLCLKPKILHLQLISLLHNVRVR